MVVEIRAGQAVDRLQDAAGFPALQRVVPDVRESVGAQDLPWRQASACASDDRTCSSGIIAPRNDS